MKIQDYISELRRSKNVIVTVADGELKISGNKEALTPDLIAELKSKKAEILSFFKSLQGYELGIEIPKAAQQDYYPLSSAQKRLYFIQEMDKKAIGYNQPSVVKLEGTVDEGRLQQALDQLVARHESLRTAFVVVEGEIYQQILEPQSFEIDRYEATAEEVDELIARFIRPFDLAEAPLFRAGLIRISAEEYILMTDTHHIISDGVSQNILIQDFMALYHAQDLPALKLQYKDFAAWQDSDAQRASLASKKEFWLEQFKEDVTPLDLPIDHARPLKKSFAGDTVEFSLSAKATAQLKALADKEGATMYNAVLAVYYVLMHKLSGQEDIVIGTPTAGREHPDLESLIGVFVNTLPLRNYPKATEAFSSFLSSVKSNTLACFDNQAYQYEELVNELKVARDTSRNALFDVVFTYQNHEQSELEISDLTLKSYQSPYSESIFDILLTTFEVEDHLEFNFTYRTELFDHETIERFATYFQQIVDTVVAQETIALQDIEVTTASEREQLVTGFNQTQIDFPQEETLVSLIEATAAEFPQHIAVRYDEDKITYGELETRSRQLATYLVNQGVSKDTLVGLCLERSVDMIVSMVAVLRAGGAYVPVDPAYPAERISYMLSDGIVQGNEGKAKLLITQEAVASTISDIVPQEVSTISLAGDWTANTDIIKATGELPGNVSPQDLAYIIYTSGSTGKPKGVMVEHRNVVSLLKNKSTHFDFTEHDVWTMFHSYCFDFSVWEMYGALLFGAELVVVPKEIAKDPKLFAKLVFERGVTCLSQTPQAFYLLQEAYVPVFTRTKVRYITFGGEALSPAKLRAWYTAFKQTRLINMYGITETTVHVTFKEIEAPEINSGISNIGVALPTLSCYVLDAAQNLAPIGVPGELYVGGAGLTRGYLNRPELTAERFIPNLFDRAGEPKLYRTGDLARRLPDGNMEYLGRIDNQVKIRGFRIELGEIEAAIQEFTGVSENVVLAKDTAGSKQLIAYCVPAEADKAIDVDGLRAHLAKSLPDYMIPAFILSIEEIPVTSNGKTDRKKLLAKEIEFKSSEEYVAPATEVERLSVDIWRDVLNVPQVGIKDNFFTLGGDSIKGIKLIYKLNETLNCELIVADLYANQTIEKLSKVITQKPAVANGLREEVEAELADYERWYKENIGWNEAYEAVYPMSGIEKGMTYYTLMTDNEETNFSNIIYHEQNIYSIPFEDFDYDVFKRAIAVLMEKHTTMRKVYDVENFAHIIYKEIEPVLDLIDITHMSYEEQQEFGLNFKDQERVKSTDFSGKVPLWRMSVIKTREDYYYLLFDMHHSVLDGWSLYSFLTELKNTYVFLAKDSNYIPEKLHCDYRDQILHELMEIKKYDMGEYWRKELADYNRFTFFKTGAEHNFLTEIHDIDMGLKRDLEKLAGEIGTSLKHVLFSAYIYTLSQFSYEKDFVVGVITNTRPMVPDADKLLGCFLNAVPFRADQSKSSTWREYIRYIEDKMVKMKAHEKIPLQKILEIIDEPAMDGNPLFDTSFNFVDFWVVNDIVKYDVEADFDHHSIDDMAFATDNLDVNQNTLFDFHIWSDAGALQMILEYSTAILTTDQIHRFRTYFVELLKQYVASVDSPKALPIVTAEEKQRLLEQYNDTAVDIDTTQTVVSLFEAQAAQTPDAPAVVADGTTLSYKELKEKSDKVAAYLQQQANVQAGDLVGLMLERDATLLPSIFGILKAGAAYVPIDPTHPASRINRILSDADLKAIVTREGIDVSGLEGVDTIISLDDKIAEIDAHAPLTSFDHVTADSLAYVIYTSGSTGQPKGVMIEHSNVVNFITGVTDKVPFGESQTILCLTTVSFDIFALESLLPLTKGLKVVVASEDEQQDAKLLSEVISTQKADLLQMTPSRLELLLLEETSAEALKGVSTLLVGGEAFPQALFERLKKVYTGRVFNMYGPTETTVWSAIKELTAEDKVNIGQPIANTDVYILSKEQELLMPGIAGELCIGGAGVARGYFNNEELTADRFIAHPYRAGERLYRTGDLARWTATGDLECLGRMDNQVKIRGFRIEVGEIESQLNTVEQVRESVVVARGEDNEKVLVAFYVADEEIETTELRSQLGKRLPDYMVPTYFVHLSSLPLNPSGKVDRRALPDHEIEAGADFVAPQEGLESQIAEIWSEVLKLDVNRISSEKSFFELGGHSLRAIVVVNRISKELGKEIPLRMFLQIPTIKELAQFLQAFVNEGDDLENVEDQEEFVF